MILRSLRVQHFRCFRNPVELSGLGTGVHVIHAPNETGKSSLMLALARALFDRYSTKDREIQQLRPWKTQLSPHITLEFETGGKRYRLDKAFLEDAFSMLDEWTGTGYERLADSQRADELVREFLSSSVPGNGATKVGHWGLARLLWLNQSPESHELPSLDTALKARLLETMGVAALSSEEQELLKSIDRTYLQFFTPKTGKPSTGSEVLQVEKRVQELEEGFARLVRRKEETAQQADEIADTQVVLSTLSGQKKEYEQNLKDLHARIEEEAALEQQIALRAKDVEQHRQQQQSLDKTQQHLLELQRKVARHQAAAAQLEPSIQEAQGASHLAQEALREATEQLKVQLAEGEKTEQRLERGRLLDKVRELLEERRQLEQHVKQGTRLTNAVASGKLKSGTAKPLSEAELQRAEELQRKLDQAKAGLEAQGVEIVFTADKAQSLEWEAQGHATEYKVGKDEQKVFSGVSAGTLRIKGVGLVSVRTGADEVEKLQGDVDKYRKELARRFHEQGVKDLAALRAAREAQQAQSQEQRKHEEALRTFLETVGIDSVEALRERQQKLAGEVGARAAQLELPVEELASYAYPELSSLEAARKEFRRELKVRERARDEAQALLEKAEAHLRSRAQQRTASLDAARTLELEMKSQLGALDLSIEQLGAEVARASAELERQENMLKGLRLKLPRPDERATTQQRKFQDALARVAEGEKTAREKIIRAEALLQQAAAEGLYSQLCETEERLELVRQQLRRLQMRAGAAESLRSLTQAWQEQVSRTFVGPIEREVQSRLSYIRGAGRSEHLLLDPEFSEAQMQTAAGPKPLGTFSWGAQEQTLFALRLALGNLLATQGPRPEPQLVVLDDALANTDEARHRRALELIESAGNTLQILVLTAFPERYRTLQGMKEFDLQALTQASRAG